MKCKSTKFYLKFPIFQIVFIILWIPIGYLISNIFSAIIVSIVFNVLSSILKAIFSFAFEMYIISGRMQVMIEPYYYISALVFDFMLLIIGLELINHFLNKKKHKENFDECSNNE